ncbi:MAG: DUF4234 domain-containing protein [Planctomycetes bacterium]|nr:DUF4234 domain-containing protein [Planctomycetota bacterium]
MGPVGKIRNPIVILLLSIITFGIYAIVWYIMSFVELKAFRQNRGLDLPVTLFCIFCFHCRFYGCFRKTSAMLSLKSDNRRQSTATTDFGFSYLL